jgi:hypothetical protein
MQRVTIRTKLTIIALCLDLKLEIQIPVKDTLTVNRNIKLRHYDFVPQKSHVNYHIWTTRQQFMI